MRPNTAGGGPGRRQSAESRNLTKVGVDSALRNECKGGSQRQNTFMGVDNAVVCLSVVLSTPMNVIFGVVTPPIQPCFESNVE